MGNKLYTCVVVQKSFPSNYSLGSAHDETRKEENLPWDVYNKVGSMTIILWYFGCL